MFPQSVNTRRADIVQVESIQELSIILQELIQIWNNNACEISTLPQVSSELRLVCTLLHNDADYPYLPRAFQRLLCNCEYQVTEFESLIRESETEAISSRSLIRLKTMHNHGDYTHTRGINLFIDQCMLAFERTKLQVPYSRPIF